MLWLSLSNGPGLLSVPSTISLGEAYHRLRSKVCFNVSNLHSLFLMENIKGGVVVCFILRLFSIAPHPQEWTKQELIPWIIRKIIKVIFIHRICLWRRIKRDIVWLGIEPLPVSLPFQLHTIYFLPTLLLPFPLPQRRGPIFGNGIYFPRYYYISLVITLLSHPLYPCTLGAAKQTLSSEP